MVSLLEQQKVGAQQVDVPDVHSKPGRLSTASSAHSTSVACVSHAETVPWLRRQRTVTIAASESDISQLIGLEAITRPVTAISTGTSPSSCFSSA
jgi:hypothetical protein